MLVQRECPDLIAIGERLRNIAITVGCSCTPTEEYAEYSRLMAVLMTTARDSKERFAMWLSHPYDGKMTETVCEVCKAVNEWDDAKTKPNNGIEKHLTKPKKKDKVSV